MARKLRLIHPKFQLGLIAVVVIFVLGQAGSSLIAQDYMFTRMVSSTIGVCAGQLSALEELMRPEAFVFQSITLLQAFFLAILFGGYFVYLSHRIFGPTYKINKVLEDYIATGKFEPIQLRKNDQFKELAENLNKAFAKKNKE